MQIENLVLQEDMLDKNLLYDKDRTREIDRSLQGEMLVLIIPLNVKEEGIHLQVLLRSVPEENVLEIVQRIINLMPQHNVSKIIKEVKVDQTLLVLRQVLVQPGLVALIVVQVVPLVPKAVNLRQEIKISFLKEFFI